MKTIETSGFSERLNVSFDGIIVNGVVDAFNVNAANIVRAMPRLNTDTVRAPGKDTSTRPYPALPSA